MLVVVYIENKMSKKTISYADLAKKVGDMVLCNNVNRTDEDGWYEHIIQGNDQPDDWDEEKDGEWFLSEIYQSFIITPWGASELLNHTNETVGYNPVLEVFVWYIHHWGTSWSIMYTEYDEDAEHLYGNEVYKRVKHIN